MDAGGKCALARAHQDRTEKRWQSSTNPSEIAWPPPHPSTTADVSEPSHRLIRPWVLEDPQLNEQAELVGPDPFPNDLVALELQ